MLKASEVQNASSIGPRDSDNAALNVSVYTRSRETDPAVYTDDTLGDVYAILNGEESVCEMLPPFRFSRLRERNLLTRFDEAILDSICATVADMLDSANIGPDDTVAIVGGVSIRQSVAAGFRVPEMDESNNYERLINCRAVMYFPNVIDSGGSTVKLGAELFADWMLEEATRSNPCVPDVVLIVPCSIFQLVFEAFNFEHDRLLEGDRARGMAHLPRNLAWLLNLCHVFKVPYVSAVCWDGLSANMTNSPGPLDKGFDKKYWLATPSNCTAYRGYDRKDEVCPSTADQCEWMESALDDGTITLSRSLIYGHDVLVMNEVTTKELDKARSKKSFTKNKVARPKLPKGVKTDDLRTEYVKAKMAENQD